VCSSRDIRFVPYDDAAMAEVAAEFVFFGRATIPAGTYRGQDADYAGLDVGSMHLIAHASTPDDLVYRVTKALWEHREAVAERHRAGRAIREGNVVRDTGIPFHPGAIRFYREAGLWPAERDDAAN
jgi:TRAP transporter TAXI family solute receptor